MPAKTVDSKPGLALRVLRNNSISKNHETKVYVLYDSIGFKNALNDNEPMGDWYTHLQDSFYSNILGFIEIGKPDTPSFNASEVKYSAAERGYGPLLYDIAMATNHGLIPDRNNVSADAENIWNKYMKRGDVSNMPLDDIDNPLTPSSEDDSELHVPVKLRTPNKKGLKFNEPVDRAFFMKNAGPNTSALLKNNTLTYELIMANYNLNQSGIDDLVKNLLNRYFEQRVDSSTFA